MALPPTAGVSLCSGIAGLDLGLRQAVGHSYRTVAYVEGEAYPAATLAARMQDGSICDAPIWSNVKTFDGKPWRGKVDCVTAGYPCQPFSHAGRRQGDKDPRHLWPAIAAIVRDIAPRWVFLENVPGHINLGLDKVCEDLESLGYAIKAGLFSAQECGARHIRQRLFVLAYANGLNERCEDEPSAPRPKGRILSSRWTTGELEFSPSGQTMAHTNNMRCAVRRSRKSLTEMATVACQGEVVRRGTTYCWSVEPNLDRVVTGLPHRLDRLRALGNAVVPATAKLAWQTLFRQHELRG